MNRENRFVVLLSMTVTLLLLATCGAPTPTATESPIAMDTTAHARAARHRYGHLTCAG